jgi:alpha-galactosidase
MRALADWLHNRSFSLGVYTSLGVTTCRSGGRPHPIPGSYGFYEDDATTFAEWTVDFVKGDWCNAVASNGTALDMQTQTTAFAAALNATGRPMWFNFHCDGLFETWCPADGNSWRFAGDHHDNWPSTVGIIGALAQVAGNAGPGGWNDPDFLMTGGQGCAADGGDDDYSDGYGNATEPLSHCPGQTDVEYLTEFSMWAMAAAPLVVATDVRNMSAVMTQALLNSELVAVDQDAWGRAATVVQADTTCVPPAPGVVACQVWARPLAPRPGETAAAAVALFNPNNVTAATITANFTSLAGVLPGAGGAHAPLFFRDLWAHENLGVQHLAYVAQDVPAHGTAVFRVTPVQTQAASVAARRAAAR